MARRDPVCEAGFSRLSGEFGGKSGAYSSTLDDSQWRRMEQGGSARSKAHRERQQWGRRMGAPESGPTQARVSLLAR